MRFYHPATGRVAEARYARIRFFLFGPFYLAWLRLWKEAAVTLFAAWVIVHGLIIIVARIASVPTWPDIDAAFDLLITIHSAPMTGASADAAFQQLAAMLMPFLIAGFALLLATGAVALRLPDYLRHYYASRGYVPLRTEEDELAEIDEVEAP
jgi:hypothetical protein